MISAAGFFVLGVVWLIGFMITLGFMIDESFELDNYELDASFTPFVATDFICSVFWPIFWPLYGIYLIRKYVS